MRKCRRIFFVFLVVVVIFVCLAFLRYDKEPSYHGRSLSEWLAAYSKHAGDGEGKSGSRAEEAREAIRKIGTNGLPFLLKRIQYEPSPLRLRMASFVEKLP